MKLTRQSPEQRLIASVVFFVVSLLATLRPAYSQAPRPLLIKMKFVDHESQAPDSKPETTLLFSVAGKPLKKRNAYNLGGDQTSASDPGKIEFIANHAGESISVSCVGAPGMNSRYYLPFNTGFRDVGSVVAVRGVENKETLVWDLSKDANNLERFQDTPKHREIVRFSARRAEDSDPDSDVSRALGAWARALDETGIAGLQTIIVPFYIDPAAQMDPNAKTGGGPKNKVLKPKTWLDALCESAKANRDKLRIIAVFNPASGPGARNEARRPQYTEGIKQAKDAGIRVLGYVHIDYGKKSGEDLVDIWYEKYGAIDGIFIDTFPATTDQLRPMLKLRDHIAARPQSTFVVANPGVHLKDENYVFLGAADLFCVFENEVGEIQRPERNRLDWMDAYPDSRFGALGYGAKNMQEMQNFLRRVSDLRYRAVYVTDDQLDNPWDRLPTYWGQLVKAWGSPLK